MPTPIGYFVIKGTSDFITSASFSDEKEENTKKLPPLAKTATKEFKDYFSGKNRVFTIPVQQPGSDFQQAVWKELQTIPYGKTQSYLSLAKQLGNAKTIRAVGNANGKNAAAIVIPCHRVIGSSGDLVGYAGGLWRKAWLLELEAKTANGVQLLF
jgi:methylated-DNA-[protein]-cysteine S-methyltransferase